MPWKSEDAPAYTRLASTRYRKKLWSTVANKELVRTGDKALAIKAANATLRRIVQPRFM